MSEPRVWQVVTAIDSKEAAEELASELINRRLAASAQVDGPVRSTYWWRGLATTAMEWRLTIKTSADRYEDMASWLITHHSYEVPELLATEVVAGHPAYVQWVIDEARQR